DPSPSASYGFLERAGMPAQPELLGSGEDAAPARNAPAPPGANATAAPRSTAAQPSSYLDGADVSGIDLSGLGIQHRPDIDGLSLNGRRLFDAHTFRRDFPILQQQVNGKPLVWLDNGATTQKPRSVIDRLSYFYEHENSNIHRGAHTLAARSTDAYEGARAKVARFINAPSPDSIIFVRGTTEGLNLIAQAWGRRNVGEGDEIVLTHLEHHANIVPWQQLAAEKGAVIKVAPVDDTGQIILEEYERLFTPRTRVASFSQVSNALGTITPVAEMVAIAQRHGAVAVVDGAQSISHMPIDVQALDADFFVFSGHKMFAPTGIGAVYGRPSTLETMPPWQGGGNMIQDVTFEKTTFHGPPARFEAGTGNIADAVGLGAAIDYLSSIGMENISTYEHGLLEYLTQGLLSVPGLRIIGTASEKAGVASFVLDECRVEDIGKALAAEGIAVRAGHHCAQPILRRFGLEATVRPSLALYNTADDVDALVNALRRIQIGRGKARY
ncbi:MAG TPA: family 2A encapsulin nanocompartment cargo protein cysteine desulfurase, partial [Hyphomicrobium sp.]|nr:family 2A encapsulin nanocompartment cargo protein cysteine desulfurase [Hyphomicrobium sp.]